MKRFFLGVLLAILAHCSFAQLRITTNYRQDGTWDEKGEEWIISRKDTSGTLFEFDKELKMFKHTTATITSNYTILKWSYNDTTITYKMDVQSDAGNKYEMLIDGINNCVAFFYWRQNEYILVRHTIKESWFKED